MNWELFYRRRAEVLLAFYSLFCLIALIKKWDLWVRGLKALLFFFLAPSAFAVSRVVHYGAHLGPRIPAMAEAVYESQVLRQRLRSYALLQMEARELRAENQKLRDVLHFNRRAFPDALVGEVVARDPGHWFTSLIVNRGQKDGVQVGLPVVAYDKDQLGLVGRVEEVAQASSRVLLISDALSSISVSVGSRHELAVLQGKDSHELLLTFIVPQAPIQIGDEVVTAGLGEIVPAGIPVGRLMDLGSTTDLSFKEATLQAFAPLSRLTEVMILKSKEQDPGL